MSSDPFRNLPARLPPVPPAPYIVSGPPTSGHSRAHPPSDTLNLAFVLRSVRQWWKIALPLGLLLAAAGGTVVWVTFKPTFRTTAWLLIKEQADYLAYKNDPNARFVQNQIELLRSPVALERVLAKPEIAKLPEIAEQSEPLEWLQKNITAKNDGGSDIYELSFIGPDPAHVTMIINAVIDSYFGLALETTIKQTGKVVELLDEELGARKVEVDRLENRVRELSKKLFGTDPLLASANTVVPHNPRDALQDQLETTEADRVFLQAQLKDLTETLSAGLQEPSDDLLDQRLESQPDIAKLKGDLEQLRQLLAETKRLSRTEFSPAVERIQSQITSKEQSLIEFRADQKAKLSKAMQANDLAKCNALAAEMRQKLADLQFKENYLRDRVNTLTEHKQETGELAIELEFKKGELERAQNVYQRIADRIVVLKTEARAPDRVTFLKKAAVPAAPEVKSPIKVLTLVCLAAFLLPFGLAIGWEHHVSRVLEPHQIVDEARLPVVGEVSVLPRRRSGPDGARQLTWSRHVFEESVDSLRTSLVLSDRLQELHVIAVVSAVSREGKTSISAQLAVSLARACDEPVLLVDADMRSPDLHKMFEVANEPGLVQALSDGTNAGDMIQHSAVNPLVHLLPAGRLHKSPHSLFGNGRMAKLVAKLRTQYRYVVIDTPPVLSASEALVVAKAADGTLICALRETSRTAQVRETYQRLHNVGAQVIGVVLSGVPTRTYAYKYGSYGYHQTVS
jgi:polysaccharide biosynthesis transport protein